MELRDYQKFTFQTIEGYPLKWRKHLAHLFLDAGIAQVGGQLTLMISNPVDFTDLELNEQLERCINNENADITNKSLAIIEEWEFIKDYKYSVLFKSDKFSQLLDRISKESQFCSSYADLFDDLHSPQLLDNNHIALLKFNRKFETLHPISGEELFIRYPIVLAFHKQEQVIEMRFDSLKRFFMETPESFYAHLVEEVCAYIKRNYGETILPLDLDFLVPMLREGNTDALLIAQSMKMANGSYAELKVEKNENYILPFIGELRNFLAEYSSAFEQVPVLREAFEQFIFEKEVTSDYPWIELLWKNEIKTRSIHVKITFDYCQKHYSLLQHYFNSVLIGMERMNHVVKFICKAQSNP